MGAYEASIVGIVNVTADSFSDGGLYLAPEEAIAHAHRLVEHGADIIELGPASSHPDAVDVSPDEEIARLAPVLDVLLAEGIPISVDSTRASTQCYCLRRGVAVLNDIRGFADRRSWPALAESDCKLVLMHSVGGRERAIRQETDADRVFAGMLEFFARRISELLDIGIRSQRLVLDPGMGLFLGSGPDPSLRVLHDLSTLRERFELPLLVSVSRKGFLRDLTGRPLPKRGAATLAAEIWAAGQGVDYIRTHDVLALRDALTVLRAIRDGRSPSGKSPDRASAARGPRRRERQS